MWQLLTFVHLFVHFVCVRECVCDSLQVYLKLQCRCLLFSESYSLASGDSRSGGEGVREERGEEGHRGGRGEEDEASDGEDVWATMEMIGEGNKKGTLMISNYHYCPVSVPHDCHVHSRHADQQHTVYISTHL